MCDISAVNIADELALVSRKATAQLYHETHFILLDQFDARGPVVHTGPPQKYVAVDVWGEAPPPNGPPPLPLPAADKDFVEEAAITQWCGETTWRVGSRVILSAPVGSNNPTGCPVKIVSFVQHTAASVQRELTSMLQGQVGPT